MSNPNPSNVLTQGKPGHDSLLKLITKAGDVLINPFLNELIDTAPSPKNLDNYVVKELNMGNELGWRLRAAVNLKQKHYHLWKILRQSAQRPAERLFEFKTAPTEGVVVSTHLLLGDTKINLKKLPSFLKEYLTITQPRISSVDGNGNGQLTTAEKFSEKLFAHLEQGKELYSSPDKQLVITESAYHGGFPVVFSNGKISFYSQLIILKNYPPSNRYPRLGKLVRIKQKLSDDTVELFDFFVTLDNLNSKDFVRGHGYYKRVITLNYPVESVFATKLELKLPLLVIRRPDTQELYLKLINARDKVKLTLSPLAPDFLISSTGDKKKQTILQKTGQLLTYLSIIQKHKHERPIMIKLDTVCDWPLFEYDSLASLILSA